MAERSQLQRNLAATDYANGGRVQACERRVETDGKGPHRQHERDFTAERLASTGIADLAAVREVADIIPALYSERRDDHRTRVHRNPIRHKPGMRNVEAVNELREVFHPGAYPLVRRW